MCTALKYQQTMGRNFDYEVSYNEELVLIPPNTYGNTYSIMGVCTMYQDANGVFPLLYDGMNENGLCMAGLAFEKNAYYMSTERWQQKKDIVGMSAERGIPVYRFIFDVLGQCQDVYEALQYIEKSVLIDKQISAQYSNSDMHWFICDKDDSFVIEQTINGLTWYRAETGVLTNNPPYPLQLANYDEEKRYIGCTTYPSDLWSTRGMETDNLKGGYTSEDRFIRASYLKEKLEFAAKNSFNPVVQSLHLLSSVEQIYGATPVNDKFEYTIYSVVYDMKELAMHIKTYNDCQVRNNVLSLNTTNESEELLTRISLNIRDD